MTDRHLRILEMVARHNRIRLVEHDDRIGEAGGMSAERRRDLEGRAGRSRARVAAAKARRRHPPQTR